MNEQHNDAVRRIQADQAALHAMTPEAREAEVQRRQKLFAERQSQAKRNRLKSRVKTWLIVAAVLVALFAIGSIFFGGTTSARLLDVGDCFDFPEETEGVERLDTPDCTEPHEGQIYHEFRAAGISPGDFQQRCIDNLDNVDISLLGEGFQAEVGNFEVIREDATSAQSVLCWVAFATPVSGSVVIE